MTTSKRVRIYSHNPGSKGALALAVALGGRVIKHKGSSYVRRPGDVVINWGSSNPPYNVTYNHGDMVGIAQCKLKTFRVFKECNVSTPEWTTDKEIARGWITQERATVFARTILNGSCGRGIVEASTPEALVDAPLYVKYVKKQDEYRVHVAFGKVIDVQRKALREGAVDPNFHIRNLVGGFVFVRGGVAPPDSVLDNAVRAVAALGLDFGAADVLYNAKQATAYVIEVNTAPGLEGQTVVSYADAFTEAMKGI